MMSFGWRPMLSCYASPEQIAAGITTSTQQQVQAQACKTATWFYALLSIAAVAGLAHGGSKK